MRVNHITKDSRGMVVYSGKVELVTVHISTDNYYIQDDVQQAKECK